jgi:UDP-N-acetyl-D-mannosaminuronic acid dehydrogenase
MFSQNKKICVVGLGYIGLPTSAILATNGYRVFGIDINKNVVDTVNNGKIHIIEPELSGLVKSTVKKGNLSAHLDIQESEIYIICVPTPFKESSKIPSPDTSFIEDAVDKIAPYIKDGDMIVLESTSPVGTTDMILSKLNTKGISNSKIDIAYCPERVLPGNIMKELISNSRVIGGVNQTSTRNVANFYKTFVKGKIIETDAKTAEMCKLTENSYRDVNIAFANELSIICDRNGVNVWELIKIANHHPRVDILKPGAGVGGHCIAVDPWFIASKDPENSKLIQSARKINDAKPNWVVNKIISKASEKKSKKIACLGLAFKPNIDDLRESPALKVVDSLIIKGYEVSCVEPNIENHNVYNLINLDDALGGFDIIALLVSHDEFIDKLKSKNKEILDFSGALFNSKMEQI